MSIVPENNPELMTAAEFRRRYGVGTTKFYELLNEGVLTARKSGTRTMIARSDAEQWVRSLPVYQPAA